MADIKVNELPTATPALTDKLFGIGASEEYQAEISGVANVVLKNYSNSSLETTSKNVVGAINELNDTTNRLEETTNEILTGANDVISEATTNWLNENVTPTGSAVAVDSSLKIAGAAADSKTVGDRFDTMEQTIENSTATDTTLSVSGKPADAKATGDELGNLKSDLNALVGVIPVTITSGGYIKTNGTTADITSITSNNAYGYAVVPCVEGDRFTVSGTGGGSMRLWAFLDDEGNVLANADVNVEESMLGLEAPSDSAYLVYNANLNGVTPKLYKGFAVNCIEEIADANTETTSAQNVILGISDITFTPGKYILTSSVGQSVTLNPVSSTIQAYALVGCYKGQRFIINGTSSTNSGRSPYMFVDEDNVVVQRNVTSTATVYSDYEIVAPCDGSLVINMMHGDGYSYSARSGFKDIAKAVATDENNIQDLSKYTVEPLTLLPPYILNSMAYKPLGALDKGYMVLVTDDGVEDGTLGICSFTIPLAIEKNVPFTFSLMSTSDVFTNETWTATLLDAIENHGCSVAQHGVRRFSTYSEQELAQFFDTEKAFFDAKGIELHGAACPAHTINKMVMAVAGGRFGVVRSGYFGGTAEDKAQYNGIDLSNFYDYYTSGANSNKYGLSCFNIASRTLEYTKSAIDYAYANKKILIALYHEFSSDLPDAAAKQKIADVIDYAKAKGMTFITLGDIEKLPFASQSTW